MVDAPIERRSSSSASSTRDRAEEAAPRKWACLTREERERLYGSANYVERTRSYTRSLRLSELPPSVIADLVSALAADEGRWSQFECVGGEDAVLGGSVQRCADGRNPLSPPPVLQQERLVRMWIERRVGVRLGRPAASRASDDGGNGDKKPSGRDSEDNDEEEPLVYALTNGVLLCRLCDERAYVPTVSRAPLDEGTPRRLLDLEDKRQLRALARREAARNRLSATTDAADDEAGGDDAEGGVDDGIVSSAAAARALLHTVGLLHEMSSSNPLAPPPPAILPMTYHACARNVQRFLRHVRQLKINERDVFEIDDLLYFRNVPRVLRTVAAMARAMDYAGFSAVAMELNELPPTAAAAASTASRVNWSEDDEPSERWADDDVLSELVQSLKKVSSRRTLSIVVAGPMLVGKSATVDTIAGRYLLPHRHNLQFVSEDMYFNDKEENLERKKRRALLSDELLRHKLESGTQPNTQVSKAYVKMHGVSVKFIELPSMEHYVAGTVDLHCIVHAQAGSLDEVRRDVEHEELDVLLVVERLDEFHLHRHMHTYERLTRLFGARVWERAVVVFTHGCALPPADVTYEEHMARRQQISQQAVHKFSGSPTTFVPNVVVENSRHCPKDESSGEPVLLDGSSFLPRLLRAMESVIYRGQELSKIVPTRQRPWWETWALGVVVAWYVAFRL